MDGCSATARQATQTSTALKCRLDGPSPLVTSKPRRLSRGPARPAFGPAPSSSRRIGATAISRYFEELHPEPALFGKGALGKAKVEMWQRRMELNLLSSVAAAFRHIHPAMKDWEVPQIPEWGEANKP